MYTPNNICAFIGKIKMHACDFSFFHCLPARPDRLKPHADSRHTETKTTKKEDRISLSHLRCLHYYNCCKHSRFKCMVYIDMTMMMMMMIHTLNATITKHNHIIYFFLKLFWMTLKIVRLNLTDLFSDINHFQIKSGHETVIQ